MLPRHRSPSALTPAQVLDDLGMSGAASRKCLRELRRMCGTRGILPTSYTLSSHALHIDLEPFASGSYGDVFRGVLEGSRVCVKRVRVYTRNGPQKTAGVCRRLRRLPCSLSLTILADLLSRGRDMETLDAPKYPPTTRHYHNSPPTHFRVDAWRGLAGVHQNEPRYRPTWACRRHHGCVCHALTPVSRYPTSLTASVTSIPTT